MQTLQVIALENEMKAIDYVIPQFNLNCKLEVLSGGPSLLLLCKPAPQLPAKFALQVLLYGVHIESRPKARGNYLVGTLLCESTLAKTPLTSVLRGTAIDEKVLFVSHARLTHNTSRCELNPSTYVFLAG